jgi:hypothetical protein
MRAVARQCVLRLVLLGTLAPAGARGAEGVLTPSLSIGAGYDDTLRGTTRPLEEALFSRVSPRLEAAYASERLDLMTHFGLAQDLFIDGLRGMDGLRGEVGLDVRVRPDRRLSLGAQASYFDTPSPTELPGALLADPGRVRSRRSAAGGRAAYRVTPTVETTFTGGFVREERAGLAVDSENAELGVAHAFSRVHTGSLALDATRFGLSGGGALVSMGLVAGWVGRLTRDLSLSARAGPRFTDSAFDEPDLSFTLDYLPERWRFELSYGRTRTVIAGYPGTFRVARLGALMEHTIPGGPKLAAAIVFSQTEGQALDSLMGSAKLDAHYPVTRNVDVTATYRFIWQEVRVAGGPPAGYPLHVFVIGLTLAAPTRAGA